MNKDFIITISRENGSGGEMIAKMISEKLSVPYYDKDLITLSAKESGFSEEVFETMEKKPTTSFLYAISTSYMMGSPVFGGIELPLADKAFLAQANVIKDLAKKGSMIVVGRCSNYVLKEYPNVINIFIYGDLKDRVEKYAKDNNIEKEEAESLVVKLDKRRSSFYNYYTSLKWGRANDYDLMINPFKIGFENACELICDYIKMYNK